MYYLEVNDVTELPPITFGEKLPITCQAQVMDTVEFAIDEYVSGLISRDEVLDEVDSFDLPDDIHNSIYNYLDSITYSDTLDTLAHYSDEEIEEIIQDARNNVLLSFALAEYDYSSYNGHSEYCNCYDEECSERECGV